jgi:hypothetical protein
VLTFLDAGFAATSAIIGSDGAVYIRILVNHNESIHLQAGTEIVARFNHHKPPKFCDDIAIAELATRYDRDVRCRIARIFWPENSEDL